MNPDGSYQRRETENNRPVAQEELMALWALRNAQGGVLSSRAMLPGGTTNRVSARSMEANAASDICAGEPVVL
jgi:hypothetical protein